MSHLIQRLRSRLKQSPFLQRIFGLLPSRWRRNLHRRSFVDKESFLPFEIGGRRVLFCQGPLEDRRGIGRVARAQLECLRSRAGSAERKGEDLPALHFFSSIHWCPDRLPPSSVVMIHDTIPLAIPELFPDQAAEWKEVFAPIARQAAHIVTISRNSAEDITRYLRVPPERISILYNGVAPLHPADSFEGDEKLPSRYFVYVGSYDHHKNLDVVLEAMGDSACDDFHLVLVGDNAASAERARRLGLEERVHYLGKLDDAAMAHVVAGAVALLFPSLYEGFGLPPMEAARLGVPAICSDRPTMNELLHDVALFADAESPAEWADAMARLWRDPSLRRRLATAAAERVERDFSPEAACRGLVELLGRVPLRNHEEEGIHILVDMQPLQSASVKGGIGRYAMHLLEGMQRLRGADTLSVLLNRRLSLAMLPWLESIVGKERVFFFEPEYPTAETDPSNFDRAQRSREILLERVRSIDPDIYLVTSLVEGLDESVVTTVGEGFDAARTAVILYDLIPLEYPEEYLGADLPRRHYEEKMKAFERAGLLLAISGFSKEQAVRFLDLPPSRIVEISAGVDERFRPLPREESLRRLERFGIGGEFLLFVGSFDSRKNQSALLEAYLRLPEALRERYDLVFVGRGRRDLVDRLRGEIRATSDARRIHLLEDIDDDELVALYSATSLFVFPSLMEGFGLPILEAMRCGAPVIASRGSSIEEILARPELLFDPTDPTSIAQKISGVLQDPERREEMRRYALERSRDFSWERTARKALEALRRQAEWSAQRRESLERREEPGRTDTPGLLLKGIGRVRRWGGSLLRLSNTRYRVGRLEEELRSLRADHETLRADHETLRANHETLRANHETLRANHETLRAELGELTIETELSARRLYHSRRPLALVSTWNTRCGIASYSRQLIDSFADRVAVLAPYASKEERVAEDGFEVGRCWRQGEDGLERLCRHILLSGFGAVWIQFNYGLFDFRALASTMERLSGRKVRLYITLHSTVDDIPDSRKRLELLAPALRRAERVLVHTRADLERLEKMGVAGNVDLFPQGVPDHRPVLSPERRAVHRPFRLGSFGFALPQKGLPELLDAVKILVDRGVDLRLEMYNARYSPAASDALLESLEERIRRYGLEERVALHPEYRPEGELIDRMAELDLLVFPYRETGESSSAAVRTALASGTPVAVTPQEIFRELDGVVEFFRGESPEEMAEGILRCIEEAREFPERRQERLRRQEAWVRERRYSRLSERMAGILGLEEG